MKDKALLLVIALTCFITVGWATTVLAFNSQGLGGFGGQLGQTLNGEIGERVYVKIVKGDGIMSPEPREVDASIDSSELIGTYQLYDFEIDSGNGMAVTLSNLPSTGYLTITPSTLVWDIISRGGLGIDSYYWGSWELIGNTLKVGGRDSNYEFDVISWDGTYLSTSFQRGDPQDMERGTFVWQKISLPPDPPHMTVSTSGTKVTISWNSVPGATGYLLCADPNQPGAAFDGSFEYEWDWGKNTGIAVELPQGASYYVAVKAYNDAGLSDYSNVETFLCSSAYDINLYAEGAAYLRSQIESRMNTIFNKLLGVFALGLLEIDFGNDQHPVIRFGVDSSHYVEGEIAILEMRSYISGITKEDPKYLVVRFAIGEVSILYASKLGGGYSWPADATGGGVIDYLENNAYLEEAAGTSYFSIENGDGWHWVDQDASNETLAELVLMGIID